MVSILIIISVLNTVVSSVAHPHPEECESIWDCSLWSDCSGGISVRICRDLSECEGWFYEEKPCGGYPFHKDFPNSGDYLSYMFRDGSCQDGTRICGSEGVVECRDRKLFKVEDCLKCYHGVCLEQEPQDEVYFDSRVAAFYLLMNITLVIFGGYLFYYGIR